MPLYFRKRLKNKLRKAYLEYSLLCKIAADTEFESLWVTQGNQRLHYNFGPSHQSFTTFPFNLFFWFFCAYEGLHEKKTRIGCPNCNKID